MEQTIICAKRAGKDLKVYAIARTEKSPKKYLYGIVCLDNDGEEDAKIVVPIRHTNLTYIRRRFRNIPTMFSKRGQHDN